VFISDGKIESQQRPFKRDKCNQTFQPPEKRYGECQKHECDQYIRDDFICAIDAILLSVK